jgi:hypothetical protein
VQKVKTAIRGLSKKAYGVLSHVPSYRANKAGRGLENPFRVRMTG